MIEIAWSRASGAESCIEQEELVARVEAVVGRRTRAPDDPRGAVVTGTVAPSGQGWLAVIEARRGSTTALRRELGTLSNDCRQLDEAIVLVLALLMDPGDPGTPVLVIPAAAQPTRVSIGADIAMNVGMLPGVALGFGLTGAVEIPPLWPLALFADAFPASQALQGVEGGRFSAWTFGLGLCPSAIERRSWGLFGCAAVTAGVIDANGVGLDVSRTETRGFVQAELEAGVRVRLAGPVYVGVEVGPAFPFAHYTYRFTRADGTVEGVFRTAPVSLIGHAALEVRVP